MQANCSTSINPEPVIPFQKDRCDSHRVHAMNPLRPPWTLLFPPVAINPAAMVCVDDLRRQIWGQVKSLETPPFCERLGSTESSNSGACGEAAAATKMHAARWAGGLQPQSCVERNRVSRGEGWRQGLRRSASSKAWRNFLPRGSYLSPFAQTYLSESYLPPSLTQRVFTAGRDVYYFGKLRR